MLFKILFKYSKTKVFCGFFSANMLCSIKFIKYIEFILKPYNYQNTHVVSNVIISNKPVKPKKIIIVAIAFLSSLMLSTFGVLCYDAIRQRIDREKQEG